MAKSTTGAWDKLQNIGVIRKTYNLKYTISCQFSDIQRNTPETQTPEMETQGGHSIGPVTLNLEVASEVGGFYEHVMWKHAELK